MKPLNQNIIDLIIKHLDKSLNADESVLFNQLLNENPAFQKELSAYKHAVTAIQLDKYYTLKSILQVEEKRITALKPIYTYKRWAVAASLLLALISVFLWLKPYQSNLKNEKLLADFYSEPYSARWLSISKGGMEDIQEQYYRATFGEANYRKLRQGWGHYLAERYAESATIFSSFNIANDTFLLARGNAYLMSNKPEKAIVDFMNIVENNGSVNKDAAEWHLIGAYIKNNQIKEAKNLATKIAQTSKHNYNKNAMRLLEKM
jgi:hypothetical protein